VSNQTRQSRVGLLFTLLPYCHYYCFKRERKIKILTPQSTINNDNLFTVKKCVLLDFGNQLPFNDKISKMKASLLNLCLTSLFVFQSRSLHQSLHDVYDDVTINYSESMSQGGFCATHSEEDCLSYLDGLHE